MYETAMKDLKSSKCDICPGIQHKVQVGMCVQRRFKSVCACSLSDQSLCFPPEETYDP